MIDAVTRFIGYHVRWLILAAVLVSAGNAIIRKAFDISSNAWLELQWLLFGAVFMLAAAYTLQKNAHVRIDVVSSRLSKRTRDIDRRSLPHPHAGTPRAIMIWLSIPFFWDSYTGGEMSTNAGGLSVWPAKFLVLRRLRPAAASDGLRTDQADRRADGRDRRSRAARPFMAMRLATPPWAEGTTNDRAHCPQSRADHVPVADRVPAAWLSRGLLAGRQWSPLLRHCGRALALFERDRARPGPCCRRCPAACST